ncbi:MAG: radical SAM/SPASM domain-containing protein [Arcobacteraceae bacterium]
MMYNNIFKQLSYQNLLKVIQNHNYQNIIAWGLSAKTKEILSRNQIHINFLVDNNKNLHNSSFQNIPIVDFQSINCKYNLLILWGNHCDEILLSILDNEVFVDIILVTDETNGILSVTQDYFQIEHSIEQKKALFRTMVKHIEIEPHSYCNRTCWFCPNSFIDRKHITHYMNQDILEQLLKDLSSIDYNHVIAFTRYSEPFGNDIFYSTLKKVRNYLPDAILHANTNSDFLNNQTLYKAYTSGLNSLLIQLYLKKNEEFTFENIDKKAKIIRQKVSDIEITLLFMQEDWIEYKCVYKDMNIRMYARDFTKNGVNRGDIQVSGNQYIRYSPCRIVFTDVYIDFNSYIVPCCNIRSDYDKHKNMNFGQLDTNPHSIFNIYFSKKAILWRKALFNFNQKEYYPCNTCTFALTNENTIIKNHTTMINNKIKNIMPFMESN